MVDVRHCNMLYNCINVKLILICPPAPMSAPSLNVSVAVWLDVSDCYRRKTIEHPRRSNNRHCAHLSIERSRSLQARANCIIWRYTIQFIELFARWCRDNIIRCHSTNRDRLYQRSVLRETHLVHLPLLVYVGYTFVLELCRPIMVSLFSSNLPSSSELSFTMSAKGTCFPLDFTSRDNVVYGKIGSVFKFESYIHWIQI